ncbi:MAG: glutamine-hydrolyzing carbamoyl-phosphate synthase small subunit [Candidatus Omnitrophica bacterium]|nr:glutamine-hydrolyzing carbamoyl-phosphate synthase small subunit [Candidatus Omnitrophota bacterium]
MDKLVKAKIVLEDGSVFKGYSFGSNGYGVGEVVFNTSMAGYQEILTDPSYSGQIVTMTYPHIGNYGINFEDVESSKPFVNGLVVKECSRITSNWRSKKGLSEYLKENNIIGIEGIDTRALTRHIRLQGEMRAVISTEELDDEQLILKARNSLSLIGRDLVNEVTSKETYCFSKKGRYKIVVIDCGVKTNILRELKVHDCNVLVVPANIDYEEILKLKPDGILISNGPGDPSAVPYVVDTVRKLIGKLPIFGICFGHQILAQALGGKTYKLKFGHHGGNHPVKDLRDGKVYITSQNHGFCVDIESLNKSDIELTHINLNDNTLEGMRHKNLPILSVQFHPEAKPGPNDAKYLFKEFILMMNK